MSNLTSVHVTSGIPDSGTGDVSTIDALMAVVATAAKQPALGTAGSAAADVITVQGKASMIPLVVDGSGVTQPVSAASLPLPTGAATAAKQPALGTAGTASADVITVQGRASMVALVVDGSGVTQPVSAASLPLPTGAATAAKQPALGTAGTASADVITVQGRASMTPLVVDGSGVTQPVSAVSLPLPALAATSTKQSDGSQKTQVVDGSGNVIGATSNALDINIKSGNPTTIAATQSGTWTVQPGNTANTTAWKVDGSAVTQPVSAVALPLPALAATSTAQADGTQKTQIVDSYGNVIGSTDKAIDVNVKSGTTRDISGGILDNVGTLTEIINPLPNGSNTIGNVGMAPRETGGLLMNSAVMLATTNATLVKGGPGQIYGIEIFNNSASIAYLKVYDAAGAPTAGSGTPAMRRMVPGNTSGAGCIINIPNGSSYSRGIGYTFTGGIADTDTTAVAASAFIVNILYK